MESGVSEGSAGRLYVVSTPIGNMGDFSFRAVEVLKSVDLILAEDTRHTRHLLEHYGIATRLAAYHEHNEARTAPALVARRDLLQTVAREELIEVADDLPGHAIEDHRSIER